ncbi:hypothetical protein [Mesorhizobium erdmanii]|uniref:hypothetical protein n=1 Tax=Mesorhizobium erdmanii TaxID=1777866 RepID=UPI00041A498D|nr:hypothetical protein [Mesorhizobium erdmanii]
MTGFARTALLALLVAASVSSAVAAEVAMKGPEILASLKGAHVQGDNWSQEFDDGGATTYTRDGRHQEGRWDVRGDQYCSLWPPSDAWACYDMTMDSLDPAHEQVTWISADGSRNTAHLIRKGQ